MNGYAWRKAESFIYYGHEQAAPRQARPDLIDASAKAARCRRSAADVSINTVYKLLEAAGPVCTRFHDETVRGVASQRIQCDEAWAFCYAKQKNVATAKSAPEDAGDVWTWTALEAGRRS
jgi:hypothetical protein